jgi:hypothetical protein
MLRAIFQTPMICQSGFILALPNGLEMFDPFVAANAS